MKMMESLMWRKRVPIILIHVLFNTTCHSFDLLSNGLIFFHAYEHQSENIRYKDSSFNIPWQWTQWFAHLHSKCQIAWWYQRNSNAFISKIERTLSDILVSDPIDSTVHFYLQFISTDWFNSSGITTMIPRKLEDSHHIMIERLMHNGQYLVTRL